jgi:hypothetical protein
VTHVTEHDEHPALVGRFRHRADTDRWHWSDEIFTMHGFAPGEVVPTTALLTAHQHPDDRERVQTVLSEARERGGPFGTLHRLVDTAGEVHTVVLAGAARTEADAMTLEGVLADLTGAIAEHARVRASEAIAASAVNRAAIEQCKGAIAFACGISPDEAWVVLRSASNDTNVPVRELAHRVTAALPHLDGRVTALTAALGHEARLPTPRPREHHDHQSRASRDEHTARTA